MKNNSLRNLLFVLLAFLLGYGVLYLGDQADSDMQTAIYREMIRDDQCGALPRVFLDAGR